MIYNSILKKKITLTSERKKHILIYHPDLKPYFASLKEVFLEPDEIRISKSDFSALLFYKFFANIKDGKYLVGVVKFNQRSFVLTAYLSERKLSGEEYEYQKE